MKIVPVNLSLLFLMWLTALNVHSVRAQDVMVYGEEDSVTGNENLLIQAQVLFKNQPYKDVVVGVRFEGTTLRMDTSKSDGFFELQLGFDTLFTLEFRKDGFVTKKIQVDTRNMPDEDKEFGYDMGMFKLSMLEEGAENENMYTKPLARFYYNPNAQLFVVDKSFKREVKKRFEDAGKKPEVIRF